MVYGSVYSIGELSCIGIRSRVGRSYGGYSSLSASSGKCGSIYQVDFSIVKNNTRCYNVITPGSRISAPGNYINLSAVIHRPYQAFYAGIKGFLIGKLNMVQGTSFDRHPVSGRNGRSVYFS